MSLNVTKEVALLKQMTVGQLRERYLQVTGEATQAANRKWLVRRIIWRMQSIEEGGLSERAIARARELASGADLRTTSPKQRSLPADADRRTRVLACGQLGNVNLPLPGTLITRMYKGRQLQVRVVTGGFEYEGELFKSLSAVAKKITGSHWSGNKFFNLSDKEGSGTASVTPAGRVPRISRLLALAHHCFRLVQTGAIINQSDLPTSARSRQHA